MALSQPCIHRPSWLTRRWRWPARWQRLLVPRCSKTKRRILLERDTVWGPLFEREQQAFRAALLGERS